MCDVLIVEEYTPAEHAQAVIIMLIACIRMYAVYYAIKRIISESIRLYISQKLFGQRKHVRRPHKIPAISIKSRIFMRYITRTLHTNNNNIYTTIYICIRICWTEAQPQQKTIVTNNFAQSIPSEPGANIHMFQLLLYTTTEYYDYKYYLCETTNPPSHSVHRNAIELLMLLERAGVATATQRRRRRRRCAVLDWSTGKLTQL